MSIFIHDNSTEFRLEVRGTLDARTGAELLQIYRTASTSLREVPRILDLRCVGQIDEAGHDSIDYLKSQGLLCKHPEPAPEPTCWRTVVRNVWNFLSGSPEPALACAPCRRKGR